jgi:hypothetical protein
LNSIQSIKELNAVTEFKDYGLLNPISESKQQGVIKLGYCKDKSVTNDEILTTSELYEKDSSNLKELSFNQTPKIDQKGNHLSIAANSQ